MSKRVLFKNHIIFLLLQTETLVYYMSKTNNHNMKQTSSQKQKISSLVQVQINNILALLSSMGTCE